MEAPSPSYILTRAAFFIALMVALLIGFGFVKKRQRRNAIFTELQSITSDSSFFNQFYADDARKSLVRAVGLIAEANTLGSRPTATINRGMGIKPKFFDTDSNKNDDDPRDKIVRICLTTNYQNFLKLGYSPDVQTLTAMKEGKLPSIPSGPHQGAKPVIAHLISPELSPGMEKVIANLEIRPPSEDRKPTDIEIATAKQLARDLSYAGIIEDSVNQRIYDALTPEGDR